MPKRSKSLSWFPALKHSWRAALRIDRSQITAVPAIRSVIGFVLPLALGVATGHVVEGVSLAGGAASLGTVGLTYAYRARMRTMLLACAAVALSAFVGSITSRIDWLAILVVGIWGIGAGLLVAVSQSAMVIGLQAVVALIILSHFALDLVHAVLQAALMFVGALLQAVLLIVPSPWQRTTPEQTALATVYQKLADYAVNLANEESSRQTRNALLKAHSTLEESNMRSPQGRMFFGLLGEADRIRLNLLILIRLRRNLIEEKTARTSSIEYLDQVIQFSADELRKIANELEPSSPFTRLTRPHQELKKSLTALRQQAPRPHEQTMQQMLAYCDTLRDQLHLVKKLAKSWKYPQPLTTAADRAIDTAVGGLLALLIYALWPTWELSQVPSNIANRLEAIRRYVVAILGAYANPGTYDALVVHNLRMEVRLARSNAEASVERSLQEPEPHRVDLDLAQGLLRAADIIAQSILTLEANLLDNPSRHALPELIPLIRNVDESLRLLVTAIREGRPVEALPNLQEELHSSKPAGKLDTSTRDETRADLRLVKAEVKRIIRSINVMNQLLATKLEKNEQREGPDTVYQESRELV